MPKEMMTEDGQQTTEETTEVQGGEGQPSPQPSPADAGEGEQGEEGQPSPQPSPADAGEGEDTPEAVDEEGKPLFGPEQQKVFEQRLGKEIGKRKALEEKLHAAEAKLAEVGDGVTAEALAVAGVVQVHPRYLSKEDLRLIQEANALEARQKDLAGDAWDEGIPSDDPSKARSAKAVRLEFAENARRLSAISVRADEAYQKALKRQIAHMDEGWKREQERARIAKGSPQKARAPGSVIVKPSAAAATRPTRGIAGPSEERFQKNGATEEAAIRELEHLVAD